MAHHLQCCEACQGVAGCSGFVYNSSEGLCYLKNALIGRGLAKGAISGALSKDYPGFFLHYSG